VPLDDDFVEIAGLLSTEAAQTEVIDDQEVGSEQAAQDTLGRVIGSGLVNELEESIGAQEKDAVASSTGTMTEGTSEEGFADTDRSHEDHILALLEEGEREEFPDTITIEGERRIPVEVLEGLLFFEAGAPETARQIFALAPIDLVLQGDLEEVERRQAGLLGVARSVRQDGKQAGELETLEDGFERGFDLDHGASFREWCEKLSAAR
jgi:hypothetical protein